MRQPSRFDTIFGTSSGRKGWPGVEVQPSTAGTHPGRREWGFDRVPSSGWVNSNQKAIAKRVRTMFTPSSSRSASTARRTSFILRSALLCLLLRGPSNASETSVARGIVLNGLVKSGGLLCSAVPRALQRELSASLNSSPIRASLTAPCANYRKINSWLNGVKPTK